MTPADVIRLMDEPINFLRACRVTIRGNQDPNPPANGPAGIRRFTVMIPPLGVTSWGATGEARVEVSITTGPANFVGHPKADEFDAYYIPMVQTSDIALQASHYTLPTGHGSLKLMLTSQLTGCTFGTGSDAHGAVLVSHVQPRNTIADGNTKAAHLATKVDGGFSTIGASVKKGAAPADYADSAAVIGRRHGRHWSFYKQYQGQLFDPLLGINKTITSVERFAKV